MKSIRCIFGWHTGQREGGTMMYECPRCRGSYWQPKNYSQVTKAADALIDAGRPEEALRLAQRAVREGRGDR